MNRIIIPVCCAVAGVMCLFWLDDPVSRFLQQHSMPREVHKILSACEHFGTPYGQLILLVVVAAMSGWQDRRGVRIFVCAATAGIAANLVKLAVARTRPRAFDFESGTAMESFIGWFPLGEGGSAVQSFPSAHTASAFGFAALLTWAAPQGRLAFLVLASLVGLQRIESLAHFPSDVCFGAALGWFTGQMLIHNRPFSRPFGRLEAQ